MNLEPLSLEREHPIAQCVSPVVSWSSGRSDQRNNKKAGKVRRASRLERVPAALWRDTHTY